MTLIGHQSLLKTLCDKAQNLKLPQVSLFYGPESIGKKQVAFKVVQKLLEVDEQRDSRVLQNSHPDFYFVEALPPASRSKESTQKTGWSIKVDQIKALKKRLVHYPLESRVQVVLIDDVHLMTRTTANSLLKLLEEPRENLYFVLVCSELGKVLPTIRSRTAKYAFKGLTESELSQVLRQNSCPSVSSQFLNLLTKAFQGSVQPILSVIESGLEWDSLEAVFTQNLSFTQIQTLVKSLPGDLDLALYLQVLKQYKLDLSLQGQDQAPFDWQKLKKAEWQLSRHIAKDFILENLFMS